MCNWHTFLTTSSRGVTQALTEYLVSALTPKSPAFTVGVWWIICWQRANLTNALQPMLANWQTGLFLITGRILISLNVNVKASFMWDIFNKFMPEYNRMCYTIILVCRCNKRKWYHLDKVTKHGCGLETQTFFNLMINLFENQNTFSLIFCLWINQ